MADFDSLKPEQTVTDPPTAKRAKKGEPTDTRYPLAMYEHGALYHACFALNEADEAEKLASGLVLKPLQDAAKDVHALKGKK